MTRSLIASTLRKHESDVADQVTSDILYLKLLGDKDLAPKLFRMRKPEGDEMYAEGLKLEDDPGRKIVPKIRKGANSTVQAYSRFDTLDVSPQDNADEVEFDWKSVSGSVHLAEEDLDKNRGSKTKIFDLLQFSLDDLKISLQEEITQMLLGQVEATDEGRKAPTGLLDLIQDDPTSLPPAGASVIGGIDASQAANAYWRNQVEDFNNGTFGTDETGEGQAALRSLIRKCTFGMERPDVVLAGEDAYDRLERSLVSQKRVISPKAQLLVKAGIDAIDIKSIPVVMEKTLDTTRAAASLNRSAFYALNFRFLRVHGMKFRWFKMTDFRMPTNQDSRVAHCITRLQHVTRGRRYLGVMFNVG